MKGFPRRGGALRKGHPLRELFKLSFILGLSLFAIQQNVKTEGQPPLKTLGIEVGKIDNRQSIPQAKGKGQELNPFSSPVPPLRWHKPLFNVTTPCPLPSCFCVIVVWYM